MDSTVEALSPLWAAQGEQVIELNLNDVTWVSPTTIVLMKATLRKLQLDGTLGEGSLIRPPTSPSVLGYMKRMDVFADLVPPDYLSEDFDRRPPHAFRECQGFSELDQVRLIAPEVLGALAEAHALSGQEPDLIGMRVCFEEAMDNVVYHAGEGCHGYTMAQATPKNGWFELAIADLGMGVCQSLTANPDYKVVSDVEAITTAMKLGVTSKPTTNKGYGLAVGSEFVRLNGGELIVRSGRGLVRAGKSPASRECNIGLPGTLVTFRTRIDGPSDVSAAYANLFPEGVADL